MKALAVCEFGHVRSVTLARILRHHGHEALACGYADRFGTDTLLMLYDWADVVYPLDRTAKAAMERRIGHELFRGCDDYMVGPDVWHYPDHPALIYRLTWLVMASPPRPAAVPTT